MSLIRWASMAPRGQLGLPKPTIISRQGNFHSAHNHHLYSRSVHGCLGSGLPTFLLRNSTDPRWPLMRVTLPQPSATSAVMPLTDTVAEKLFRTDDDLAIDVPSQSNKPSMQRWEGIDTDGDGKPDTPLARQSRGDYSWIVTVVPPSSDARNALATDPTAYEYEVSVAVFYSAPSTTSPTSMRADRRPPSVWSARRLSPPVSTAASYC